MPANYTHYRFGKCVLQVFPESLNDIVSHDLQAFYTGLHGPDLFFYHRPFSGHSLRTYGTRLHDEPAAAFFEKGAEVVRCADQDTTLCYLLGFLCHFVLDSACHGYIDEYERIHHVSHAKIEAELDKHFMRKDGLDIHKTNSAAHIVASRQLAMRIAPLFDMVSADQIVDALSSMHRLSGWLVPSSKGKVKSLQGILSLHPKMHFIRDMILSDRDSRKCRLSTVHLERVFETSVLEAAKICEAYIQTVDYHAPLPNLFLCNYESRDYGVK